MDPETEPGDAMERMIDYARRKSQKQGSDSNRDGGRTPDDGIDRESGEASDSEADEADEENKKSGRGGKDGVNPDDKTIREDGKASDSGSQKGGRSPRSAPPGGAQSREDGGNATAGMSAPTSEPPEQNSQNSRNTAETQEEAEPRKNGGENESASNVGGGSPPAGGAGNPERTPDRRDSGSPPAGGAGAGDSGRSSGSDTDSGKPGGSTAEAKAETDPTGSGRPSDVSSAGQVENESDPRKNRSGNGNGNNTAQNGTDSVAEGKDRDHGNENGGEEDRPESGESVEERGQRQNDGNDRERRNGGVTPATKPSGKYEEGDRVEAAPKGTEGRNATRSDDPALDEAARKAVEDGAEMASAGDHEDGISPPEVTGKSEDAKSTAISHDSDDHGTTGSETPVRPGDPRSRQELHPETPNRPAAERTPDAMSGDGRNTGGTRPTDRPEPVNAPGEKFRDPRPDGRGNQGSRPDERGLSGRTTSGSESRSGGESRLAPPGDGRDVRDVRSGEASTGTRTAAAPDGQEGDGGTKSDGTRNDSTGESRNAPGHGGTGNARNKRENDDTSSGEDTSVRSPEQPGGETDTSGSGETPVGNASRNTPDSRDAQGSRQTGPGGGTGRNSQVSDMAEDGSHETGPDVVGEDFTRRNTDLALRTLEESLREQDPSLLNQLGWSREQAEAFLAELERLHVCAT
ncbi:MAG: hypothetical protein Q4C47_08005, partial [Planctomycetia bacterium]|nr:hypothetical protein [Planctomycetia bacterium]